MPDLTICTCPHGSRVKSSYLTVLQPMPAHFDAEFHVCPVCAYNRGFGDGLDHGVELERSRLAEGRSQAPTGNPDSMPPRNDSRKLAWNFCEREHGIFESCPFCDGLTAQIERARREDVERAIRPMQTILAHPGFESIVEDERGYTVRIALRDGHTHEWTGRRDLLWKIVYDDLVRWNEDKVRAL